MHIDQRQQTRPLGIVSRPVENSNLHSIEISGQIHHSDLQSSHAQFGSVAGRDRHPLGIVESRERAPDRYASQLFACHAQSADAHPLEVLGSATQASYEEAAQSLASHSQSADPHSGETFRTDPEAPEKEAF